MSNSFPLVSVIIPVYNAQDYVRASIESVLRQTYKNLEIIVVNDGSTDDSLLIIDECHNIDSRIICINKKNAGLPLARKSGIDVAKGKYIQHLDSDDTLIVDAIERLVVKAEESDADIVAAPFFFCYPDREPEISVSLSFDELSGIDYYREILNNRGYWSVWSNFQKRSLYLDHSVVVVPDISFGEDAILMTQLCLSAVKVASISNPILNYNRYPTSMSFQIGDKRYREFRAYQVWIEQYLEQKGLKATFQKELASMHVQTTFQSLHWKKFDSVKRDMKRLIEDFKKYPELSLLLSKRQKKLLSYYRKCSSMGYLLLMYYNKRGKL